jgi:hypothetical protein
MTTIPVLLPHFQFHQFLLQHLLGLPVGAPTLDCDGLSPRPNIETATSRDFSDFTPALQSHTEDPLFVSVSSSSIPVQFRLSVEFYARIQNDKLRTYRLNDQHTITVPPKCDSLRSIAQSSFEVLFNVLSIVNIVRILRALLLEDRILLVSSDIHILTTCTLSIIPLALPMTYQYALRPYLPDSFLPFLESSVPYCFGLINNDRFGNLALNSEITLVDLDTNRVVYPEAVPHLPHAASLRTRLAECLKSVPMVAQKKRMKYAFGMADVERCLDVFARFVGEFVKEERICACRVKDTTDPANPRAQFVKEVYMLEVPATDIAFFDRFLQTQAFATYFQRAAV